MANPNIPNLTLNDTLNSFRTKFNQLLDSTSATDSDFGIITDRVDSINNTELVSARIRLTDSTATSTIDGQLTVGKNATFEGDVQIDGSITVDSDFTVGGVFTVTGEQKTEAQYITLNSGVDSAPTDAGGIAINRGTSDSAIIQWNETSDYWEAGTVDSLYRLALQGDSATFDNVRIHSYTVRNVPSESRRLNIQADSSVHGASQLFLLANGDEDAENPTVTVQAITDTLQNGTIKLQSGKNVDLQSFYGDIILEPQRYIQLGDKRTNVTSSAGLIVDTQYGGSLNKRARIYHMGAEDSADDGAYIQWDYVPTTEASPESKITYHADSHAFSAVNNTTVDFTASSGTNIIQSNTDLKIGVKQGEDGALILEAGAVGATDDNMIFRTRGTGTASLGTHIFYADSSSTTNYMRFFIPGANANPLYNDNVIYGPGEMRIMSGVSHGNTNFDGDDIHRDLNFAFLAVDDAENEIVVGANTTNPAFVIHNTKNRSTSNTSDIIFRLHENSSTRGNPRDYAQIRAVSENVVNGAEDGRLEFHVRNSGTLTKHMTLFDSGGLMLHNGDLMGNASTASAWETGREISLTGDVTGTVTGVDGSGNISISSTLSTSVSLMSIVDGDGTTVTMNKGNYIKVVEGQGIDANFTDTSTGSSSDPYDLTLALKANGVRANELNVSGNGSSGQYLASDGDGSFSWVTPGNATITISAGTDLSTGGNFTTNASSNKTITINHADTSTLSGTYGSTSDTTKIDQITVDGRGHVTAITTGPGFDAGDARAAQHASGSYAGLVGQYRLARWYGASGAGSAPNTTVGGSNLGAADVQGNGYKYNGSYSIFGGSWRRMGYQHSNGSLTSGAHEPSTTLWVRYA